MTGQSRAQDAKRQRGSSALAEPHREVENGLLAERLEQAAVSRLGAAMAYEAMHQEGRVGGVEGARRKRCR